MGDVKIESSWKQCLQQEFDKPYFTQLTAFVRTEYQRTSCFPPGKLIFNAFNLCPFDKVKVVIIGQDPYHEQGQAMGLSFSVPDGIAMPPSLVNIFKEIQADLGVAMPASGNLTRWAQQGVLLLNATLTVRAHQAASHQRKGWETFTQAVKEQVGGVHVLKSFGHEMDFKENIQTASRELERQRFFLFISQFSPCFFYLTYYLVLFA